MKFNYQKIIITIITLLFLQSLSISISAQCCLGDRGNFNGDINDEVDISDVVFLVDYMFNGGDPYPCFEEADIFPNDSPDGSLDISDLVAMIDYMFNNGPAPPPCPALIQIVNLNPGDNVVNGTTSISTPWLYKVVLYAKTDKWYVQPSVSNPLTTIQGDGSWSNSTYPWDRMLALLVDLTYVPQATKEYHPSVDPGVVAYDEYPGDSGPRFIDWSGYRWEVKVGDLLGPGPNYFSDDTLSVWVDNLDRLHETIDYRDSKWYCSEIILDHSLGYGLYKVQLDSRVDSLDYNTIFSPFIYEMLDEEFDIEFSQRLAAPFNAQYVVQPWYTVGNIKFFHMPIVSQSTHTFEWRSDRITFTSWQGHSDTAIPGVNLIYTWTYTGVDIPVPGGERMRFNLHLFGGDAPVSGLGDEVIVKSFEFTE